MLTLFAIVADAINDRRMITSAKHQTYFGAAKRREAKSPIVYRLSRQNQIRAAGSRYDIALRHTKSAAYPAYDGGEIRPI